MTGEASTFELKVKGTGDPRGELGTGAAVDLEGDLLGYIAQDPETRYIRVSRLRPDGARAFLATMPVEAFSFEGVRDQWGGGAYHVALLNGAKKIRTQTKIDIEGAPAA